MGSWEDEHFERCLWELSVWGRDGLTWLRSSLAGPGAIEVAAVPVGAIGILDVPAVAVRHGRLPAGAGLLFDVREWAAFVAGIRGGEFTRLRQAASVSTIQGRGRFAHILAMAADDE